MFPIRGTFRVISTIPSTEGGEGGRVKSPRGKTVMRSAPRGKPAQSAQRPPGSRKKRENKRRQPVGPSGKQRVSMLSTDSNAKHDTVS